MKRPDRDEWSNPGKAHVSCLSGQYARMVPYYPVLSGHDESGELVVMWFFDLRHYIRVYRTNRTNGKTARDSLEMVKASRNFRKSFFGYVRHK